MPTKSNYEDHEWVLEQLKACQEAEHDMREQARECHLFLDKKDGQWEPFWWSANEGRPRYTFDQCSSIVAQILGQVKRTDFDINVRPQNGPATKETAQTYDGIVRNIENISRAKDRYRHSAKKMVKGGIDGWEVVQKYADGDSFDQDLVIQKIPDYVNRCWLGPHTEQDADDADYGWVLTGFDKEEYKAKYPDRAENASLSGDKEGDAYWYRSDQVLVGQFRYLVEEERELVLMSNGKTFEANEDYERIRDELAEGGVVEVDRRKRKIKVMYARNFDADGWIDDKPKATVFRHRLNIIPVYANFDITDDGKLVYYGAVLKLMDPQRVLNYVKSREVEELSLSPRRKIVATPKMAETGPYQSQWQKLNTSSDPVLFMEPDERMPQGITEIGGAMVNAGLATMGEDMKSMMREAAGKFHANMGDNPNAQSGVAIDALQAAGDVGDDEYISALEIAIAATGRLLVDAIPRVYKPGRQVRILDPDGTYDMETIGDPIFDNQSQEWVYQYDLGAGKYDVYCTSGPSFQSRQSKTLAAFQELGQIVPGVIEANADIILTNVPAPGMDQAAARVRRQLFNNGMIPEDQMTDEELALYQQMQQQPPQEDPNMVLARAEEGKAQADLIEQQNKQIQIQGEFEVKKAEIELKREEQRLRRIELAIQAEKVGAEIKGIGAKAAKDIADAEAQDIENDATKAGITKLAEVATGG